MKLRQDQIETLRQLSKGLIPRMEANRLDNRSVLDELADLGLVQQKLGGFVLTAAGQIEAHKQR